MSFPALILIAGGPGAGKTALGRALAREIPEAVLLDKDIAATGWVDAMLDRLNEGRIDRDSAFYWNVVRPLEYASLMALAMDNLAVGKSVIAVAPFTVELADSVWKQRLKESLREQGARLKTIWMRTDPASARIRMAKRRDARDDWKLGNWERFLETAHFLPPSDDLFVLLNSGPTTLVDLLKPALAYLKSP